MPIRVLWHSGWKKTIRENELDIKVIPMATGTASKFKRIKAWVKQLAGANGRYWRGKHILS